MKKLLLAVCGALGLVVAGSGAAFAQPVSPAAGTPSLTAASPYGYYIWFVGDRVHLRTTDPHGDASVYTGTVATNGAIRHVDLLRTEDEDWAVAGGGDLDFHFRTANHVDGVSFTAAGATRLTFRLYHNGHLIRTDHIFLGAGGAQPPSNPFTLFQ